MTYGEVHLGFMQAALSGLLASGDAGNPTKLMSEAILLADYALACYRHNWESNKSGFFYPIMEEDVL